MARKKSCFLPLLLLLLFFLLTCLAHPLAPLPAHNLGKKNLQVVEEADQQATGREARLMEEEDAVSTLEIANNDYPGSGANNRHDPKTPARP